MTAKRRGFTLIELMIVVTIIMILATTIIFTYPGIRDEAMKSQAARYCTCLQDSMTMFQARGGKLPLLLDDISVKHVTGQRCNWVSRGNALPYSSVDQQCWDDATGWTSCFSGQTEQFGPLTVTPSYEFWWAKFDLVDLPGHRLVVSNTGTCRVIPDAAPIEVEEPPCIPDYEQGGYVGIHC
ncbi:MAG: type II secretion system protein [Thermoanaerobaculia bacterium]|nr:type II secretion system protein [Thermoanaerobaculia bacterium]